jgi:DNA invertase Pin-like site-specific DNA recombinase
MMIADCRAGKIDMIITKSISQFVRNTLDCLNYVRELKDLGIGIIFEKENINTLDAKGEVLLTILSSLMPSYQREFGNACSSK